MNFEKIEEIVNRLHSYVVVGAYGLAAHGYVRQTADFDVLTADRAVLSSTFWDEDRATGTIVEIHRGDFDDPLDGVARVRSETVYLDVIVARLDWQAQIVARGAMMNFGRASFRVARAADLILLKVDAGGHLDLHDAHALLAQNDREVIRREISLVVPALPRSLATRVSEFFQLSESSNG